MGKLLIDHQTIKTLLWFWLVSWYKPLYFIAQ